MREVSKSALNTPIHSMSSIPSYIFYARIELSKCVGVLSTLLLTYLIRQKADSETNWWFSKPTYPVCLLKNNIWMDLKSLWLIHRKIMRWTFWILVQIFWTKLCRILICFRICLLPDERSERKCTQHANTFDELDSKLYFLNLDWAQQICWHFEYTFAHLSHQAEGRFWNKLVIF